MSRMWGEGQRDKEKMAYDYRNLRKEGRRGVQWEGLVEAETGRLGTGPEHPNLQSPESPNA